MAQAEQSASAADPGGSVATSTASHLKPTGLQKRTWWALVLVGLVGQVAWVVENMYLNLFVYNTITDDPTVIAAMVAVSAISATAAAFVVGAWSDRVGRRRVFIAMGYVLWGLSTMTFGIASVETLAGFVPVATAAAAAATTVIVIDAIMSFLGAGANDASFNAWVTDVTDEGNRGRVETVLTAMPLVAMLLVFGGLDGLTKNGDWGLFFIVTGLLMIIAGGLAWLLVRDAPGEPVQHDTLWRAMVHGLRPSAVRADPDLYVALAALAIVGISSQIFLPYLLIYIQNYLQIDAYALVLAVVLIGASVVGHPRRPGDRPHRQGQRHAAGRGHLRRRARSDFPRARPRATHRSGPGADEWVSAQSGSHRRVGPRLHATGSSRYRAGPTHGLLRRSPDGHRACDRGGCHQERRCHLRRARTDQASTHAWNLPRGCIRRAARGDPRARAAQAATRRR
ncbi:MAG: MFS transporter [Candidatus Nanopelagicales bacterium]